MTDPTSAAPSLDLLRGFEAAARHLNFTRAADELFITQSAVSRQIKTLEDRLGVTLFLRQPKGLRLTQQGERLYRAVSSALRQVSDAMEGLSRRTGPSVVTVTSTLGFCALWLVPRLSSFQKSFPEVEVRIAASDRILNLDRERIDVSIRYCPPHDDAQGGGVVVQRRVAARLLPGIAGCARAAAARAERPAPSRAAASRRPGQPIAMAVLEPLAGDGRCPGAEAGWITGVQLLRPSRARRTCWAGRGAGALTTRAGPAARWQPRHTPGGAGCHRPRLLGGASRVRTRAPRSRAVRAMDPR